uniref:Uncharacterized protein n=1 Tax=Anguilla anguilla TaxID=7936 RepID=A0A0E9SM68_ANGAN
MRSGAAGVNTMRSFRAKTISGPQVLGLGVTGVGAPQQHSFFRTTKTLGPTLAISSL